MKKILQLSPMHNLSSKNNKFYGINLINYKKNNKLTMSIFKENYLKNHKKARRLEAKLGVFLIKYLNQIHGKRYSKKIWYIYIGYWLRRYSNIIVNRFCLLNYYQHFFDEVILFKNDKFFFYVNDSIDFNYLSSNSLWNSALIGKIAPYINIKKKINYHYASVNFEHYNNIKKNETFVTKTLKFIDTLLAFLSSKKDNLMFFSKINKLSMLKIYFYCKQIPRFLITPVYKMSKCNFLLRNKLSQKYFIKDHKDKTFQCANNLLFDCLPISYLEDFNKIEKITNKLNWPKFPKKIITDCEFDTNEIFKLKVLQNKIFNKSKYYIMQHGNNYGTSIHTIDNPEEYVANKFFNWGLKNKKKNIVKFFNHSTYKNKKTLKNSIFLYLDHKPNFDLPWNNFDDWQEYLNCQEKFISHLSEDIKKNLYVKFNNFSSTSNKDMQKKLNLKKYKIKIYKNKKELLPEISIFGYDGTGFFEKLNLGMPTIAFWDINKAKIKDIAKKDFKKLEESNLIFKNPIKAAEFLNSNYHDIHIWWSKKKIQNRIKVFTKKYSRRTLNIDKKIACKLK